MTSTLPRAVRTLAIALAAAALPALGSGCSLAGLFYKHSYRSDRFVIYSDHDPEFLARVGPEVETIYSGYERLFRISPAKLGRTKIILRGDARDQHVVDLAYSPNLLGYYIPFFNMISVDTKPVWAREKSMLEQILLHEIAHHFIITGCPEAGSKCWLNEGLAGNLEMTLFEGERFEYPLLNPTLLGIARRAVQISHPGADLKRLLSMDWSEFHNGTDKDINYSLSWAIVYFLLQEHFPREQPLIERIWALYRIQPEEVMAEEGRFIEFLRRFDLTETLVRLARSGESDPNARLTPVWAIRQLGNLKFLDDARSILRPRGHAGRAGPDHRRRRTGGLPRRPRPGARGGAEVLVLRARARQGGRGPPRRLAAPGGPPGARGGGGRASPAGPLLGAGPGRAPRLR